MRGESALGAAVCLLVATSMAAPVPPYAYSQLMDMYLIQLQYQQQETALAAKQHGTSDVMCLEWPTRYTLYNL